MEIINYYFEILSKPRAEITMIDQMVVALPFMILLLMFLVYLWLEERRK